MRAGEKKKIIEKWASSYALQLVAAHTILGLLDNLLIGKTINEEFRVRSLFEGINLTINKYEKINEFIHFK